LRALRNLIVDEHIASVALPRLGGLDWSEVKPLIDNQLGDVAAEIRESAPAKKALEALARGHFSSRRENRPAASSDGGGTIQPKATDRRS
jgi:hypothetical protein